MSKIPKPPRFEGNLQPGPTCPVTSELMCCEFNQNGELLAVGTGDGAVAVFQPTTGAMFYQLYDPKIERLPITAVRFMKSTSADPQNILLVAYSSGHVRHWQVSSGQCYHTIDESRHTLAAAYASDYLSFATAGSDNKVYLYDQGNFKLVRKLESSMTYSVMDGHMSRVFGLTYHPTDPHILVSAGWDDTLQFWDTREQHSIRKISGPHVCGDAVDIEPSTLNIVTGSWQYHDALQVWDFDSGKLLSTLQPDLKSKLYGVCWTGSESVLTGGSQQHVATVVNTKTDEVIAKVSDLDHGVYGVDYCPDTSMIAIAAGTNVYSAIMTKSQTFMTQED